MKPLKSRLTILSFILLGFFVATFFFLGNMMILQKDKNIDRAATRSSKSITLYGMRGTIYDTNMVPLAYDMRSYNITFYRDPAKSSEAERKRYTMTLMQVIQMVEKNGKSTINDFWLKKDANGKWHFNSGATSESVEATRERQWRSNFYLTNTPDDELWVSMIEKYCIPSVITQEMIDTYNLTGFSAGEKVSEDMQVKILALWQECRMNAFNSTAVTIAYDVGYETVSEIQVKAIDLQGIDVEESSSRIYPLENTACHVTGYVSKISANTLDTYQAKGYPNNAMTGSDGIERSLEDQLSPYVSYRQGKRSVEVDTRGKVIRERSYTAPTDGNSVVLTIDADLQNVMAKALQDTIDDIRENQETTIRSSRWRDKNADVLKDYAQKDKDISMAETGAMVAMDPYTGRVLGMVSLPDFNLSMFNGGNVDPVLWSEVLEGNDPLYNRAISTKDAPGSIFKLCTALAGLSEGVITLKTRISDEGGFYKTDSTHPAKCWTNTPELHANQTVVEGLKNSCNYFFYTVGYGLGIEKLYEWSAALGLTSKTNIELPGEATSYVGNQNMLYDPNATVYHQQTSKPLITSNAIRKELTQVAEERKENYSDEIIDKAVYDLMLIPVTYDKKTDWYQPIREVLMYDLGIPLTYISGHYMVNTFVTYLSDIYWTPNETIMAAIGQSITQVTPIAVARYVSAIVNGGIVYDAQIVDRIIAPDGTVVLEKEPVIANRIVTDSSFYTAIQKGMQEVTSSEDGGTAGKYFEEAADYHIAAKTGTSQRTELDVENNSWLVAYAPYDDPKIVVVAYIQNGYSGAYSSPAVIETIEYYLDSLKKKESYAMTKEFSLAE